MCFEAVVESLHSSTDVVERKFTFNIHKSVCGAQGLHKKLGRRRSSRHGFIQYGSLQNECSKGACEYLI